MALIAERRPRRRAGAQGLRRRLRAPPRAPTPRARRRPRPCTPRSPARSTSPTRAASGRSPCAPSRRRWPSTATSRPGRCWRRARRTCRSCSTPCARRCSPRPAGSSASSIRSWGSSATRDGHITAVLHPREGGSRESVMHFELDRRLAARGARARSPTHRPVRARRRPPRGARLPGDVRPRAPHGPLRRRRRGPLRRRRGRRDGRLPRVAAARQLHLPRLPGVPDRRPDGGASCPAPASASWPTRRARPSRARAGWPSCPTRCARASSRATC